jgi:hypothetical protein
VRSRAIIWTATKTTTLVRECSRVGIHIDIEAAHQYLVDVEIKGKGKLLFSSSAQI